LFLLQRRDVNRTHVQLLIVGSGFAGSLMAMIARRLGYSTLLVERGKHPRFAIGESSTPLANLLLEEIATDYDLPGVRPLCKWGTWQVKTPHIACGLKRGFTFYHHQLGRPFEPDPERERQLLVGASPNEEIADTHWYRPDFDHYLVEQAQALGVDFLDEIELTAATQKEHGMLLRGKRYNQPVEFLADFVIDASGPRGFLHRVLTLPEKNVAAMPATQALFSHFKNVAPLEDTFCADGLLPPYPPEQAAVHHIFEGGWIWVLKFNNGVTSAGVAATGELAQKLELRSGEPAWRRLMDQLPSLATSFSDAPSIIPFVFMPRVSFQSGRLIGPSWALLPSAAGVIDPLLSTGFPLTLLGIVRLARMLELHGKKSSFQTALEEYAQQTTLELETTACLVGACYATMQRFDLFKPLTVLYFAAASYAETARRLGKGHLANGFLLCNHKRFYNGLQQVCDMVLKKAPTLTENALTKFVHELIAPFDVAGLTDPTRHPWYPARPADLLASAQKLGATQDEMVSMLRKCQIIPGRDLSNPCEVVA
jgi:FADH2 O2-dependent halogenase